MLPCFGVIDTCTMNDISVHVDTVHFFVYNQRSMPKHLLRMPEIKTKI